MLGTILRSRLMWVVTTGALLSTGAFAGCAGEADDDGGGGEGGDPTVTTTTTTGGGEGGGFTTSATTTTTTTTTSGMMTTGVTTSSASTSTGMGGMGGAGGGSLYPPETEPNGTLGIANELPMGALGFTATITDPNDFDVFKVDVPIGSSLRVAISDGMGGCPADATVNLQVYDPNNLEIAAANGLCPELSGANDPDLGVITTPGMHFIRVTASQAVAQYVVEIEVSPPVCGDGIPQLGEECDDGNMTNGDGCQNDCTITPVCGDNSIQVTEECDDGNVNPGDGCDAGCLIEGNYCHEVEPNEVLAMATPITGSCVGGSGHIKVNGDKDWFAIQVTVPNSSLRAEVVNTTGTGCPTGFDSLLRLYNSGGTQLGSDDLDGVDNCSLITPTTDVFAQNLAVGTYYLSVEEDGNNAISKAYVLLVSVNAPGCGDGVVQAPGEECDDGNLSNGDGCDSACQLEGNYCPEIEPNETQMQSTSLVGCDGGGGVIGVLNDQDYYSFQVTTAGSSVRAEITDITGAGCPGTFDSYLTLYNNVGTQLGVDDDDGNANCSLINPTVDTWARNLPIGTYHIKVNELGNNATSPPYLLKLQVNPPACGDGILQVGEQCDDGNLNNGDGCSSTCTIEGNYCAEMEPNDSFGSATPLAGCQGGSGQISFIGDPDYFSFQVTTPGSSVRLEVVSTTGSGCPTGFDSFLRLYDSSMNQLGTDDLDGADNCSLISPATDVWATNLPVGTYFARVEEDGNNATSPAYLLKVNVAAPGCGDSIVQVGEQCDDGNTVDGDGCSSSCQLLSCTGAQIPVTLDALNLNLPILDNNPGSPATATLNVSQTGTVAQVAVRVNITHSWMGDTETSLTPPAVAEFKLADNVGGSGDNFLNTVFSSTAVTPIASGTAPFTGVFVPSQPFGATVGSQAQGTWTLKALDNVGGIAGVLDSFSLYLCVNP